jgi:hypothetical protein
MEKACININELINVFSTANGAIYQSDKLNCLYIDFGQKFARFNFNQLKKLKHTIEEVDIEALLLNTSRANYEIITFNGCEHIFLLSVIEIVQLKELVQGAFTMFKLNHLINDCLHRLTV